jgi:ferrochelatase
MDAPAVPALVLSCHGSVERFEDLPAFLRNIRRGREPSAELVHEVERRYRHIGGSPLMAITRAQGATLEQRLGIPVRVAGRLWHPYPREVVAELAAAGATHIRSLPLAPQSVHVYNPVVEQAAREHGLTFSAAASWGLEPLLVAAFVEAIDEAIAGLAAARAGTIVLTAHSLPRAVIAAGDPYERDFRAMAEAVAGGLGERGVAAERVRVAFQSAGMDGGEWLGPDLASVLRELRAAGVRDVVVAPIGFLADHVETLYDIDVEAAAIARDLGFEGFGRMPAMNTRPAFLAALEAVARRLA